MRIVFVCQWFPPEQAPIGYMIDELAQAAIKLGHQVTIITGFPNHPTGVVFPGYKKRFRFCEMLNGVSIWRMYIYTSPGLTWFSRVLNFLSFTVSSALALLLLRRCDMIFAVNQPLTAGLILPFIAKFKKSKLILNIQDLHPDVPIELGLVRNKLLIYMLRAIERFGYLRANALAVISDGFKVHCVSKGSDEDKIKVIPNWIDLDEVAPVNRMNAFRDKLGLTELNFVVLYAGTVGHVSGAHIIIEAAKRLQNDFPELRFLFVGDGPVLPDLISSAKFNKLSNIIFAPFQARLSLPLVQGVSDVSIVTMLKGKGRLSVPSKVLGYMAAGRPVIGSLDSNSETASLIINSKCGIVVEPGNVDAIVSSLILLMNNEGLRSEYASNGRKFLETFYTKDLLISNYIDFFHKVTGAK